MFLSQILVKAVEIFLPTATSAKIAENDTKLLKIKTKIWKDICIEEYQRAKVSNVHAVYHLQLKIDSSADSFKEVY